ncbi:hypothetical protein V8G54_032474 [Vigna mungo]|uniref:Uncharacterized protein n=1 Tax=Vigna mungo TaxID=3915 RepID=A0AAQ3RGQ2_VIGMU
MRRLLEMKELTIWLTVVMVKHHDLAMRIGNFRIDFVILVCRFLWMEVLGGALEKLFFAVFTMDEIAGVSGFWLLLQALRKDDNELGSWLGVFAGLEIFGDGRRRWWWSTVVFLVVRCEKDEPAMVDHGGACERYFKLNEGANMAISWWKTILPRFPLNRVLILHRFASVHNRDIKVQTFYLVFICFGSRTDAYRLK